MIEINKTYSYIVWIIVPAIRVSIILFLLSSIFISFYTFYTDSVFSEYYFKSYECPY